MKTIYSIISDSGDMLIMTEDKQVAQEYAIMGYTIVESRE